MGEADSHFHVKEDTEWLCFAKRAECRWSGVIFGLDLRKTFSRQDLFSQGAGCLFQGARGHLDVRGLRWPCWDAGQGLLHLGDFRGFGLICGFRFHVFAAAFSCRLVISTYRGFDLHLILFSVTLVVGEEIFR